ncbi:indolepyruvate oxidoreductase subunit beta family protein [Paenalcaligenes sp. Me52]|uniref:indolepyruvate oxidoreductase subunit beta family protein n=1 Tax=Paenalcaligenes sp. Me52 TaxID=3392038 RepID=UPI003D282819
MQVKPIKIAILAMGGEGGGVLADWVVSLGEHNGYFAQTTSVPGVAQRTGATIYYVELFPISAAPQDKKPVLSLMPMPGDVDIVLASELMEAGRAVQRGIVTDDRTTLIASTHRVYSIAEKTAMGDGRVDSDTLIQHAKKAAKRFIHFNMAKAAEDAGSVISAVMFGALSAAGVLPFSREQFEQTIERGGVGVKPSLRAFDAAYSRVNAAQEESTDDDKPALPDPATVNPKHPRVATLVERIRQTFPASTQPIILEGTRRLIDFQDVEYGELYVDRLAALQQNMRADDHLLLSEAARYLALWMSFEDAIRVAELKTRATRFERVSQEVQLESGQILAINEYMHPRVEEISEILPCKRLARWLLNSKSWGHRLLRSMTGKGRIVQTSSLRGFLLLNTLSGMKRWRRKTLRYEAEQLRIDEWLQRIAKQASSHPALALEITRTQRLVKGYGDTHQRGLRNFSALMQILDQHADRVSPEMLHALRDAALADEHGKKLDETRQAYALV